MDGDGREDVVDATAINEYGAYPDAPGRDPGSVWISLNQQVWTEDVDAGSFPDKRAQRTLDPYHLAGVSGATDEPTGDLRDAYCIRISDPASFRATTDPAVDPTATATFDTRLFLFTPEGTPVLANDNTSGATPLSMALRSPR